MNRTPADRSTLAHVVSSEMQQIPLRGRGLHIHDSHDFEFERDIRGDLRTALRRAVENYDALQINPPHDKTSIGAQCARWANRHPAMRDQYDRELMSSYAFYAAVNRYVEKKYENYICNPNQKYLSKKIGISIRSIQRRNKKFVVIGAIRVERIYDADTGRTMNFYVLPG